MGIVSLDMVSLDMVSLDMQVPANRSAVCLTILDAADGHLLAPGAQRRGSGARRQGGGAAGALRRSRCGGMVWP